MLLLMGGSGAGGGGSCMSVHTLHSDCTLHRWRRGLYCSYSQYESSYVLYIIYYSFSLHIIIITTLFSLTTPVYLSHDDVKVPYTLANVAASAVSLGCEPRL